MLDQIEKALYAEDPKFAQSVRARDPRVHYRRRIIQAAIGFLIGVGLLLAGVITKHIWMGVAGFLVMLTCAMWALTSWRHMSGAASAQRPEAGPGTPVKHSRLGDPGQGFMERLEERWRRRQENGG
jgi:predicted lipid-binding transport protein (Tim44 family)